MGEILVDCLKEATMISAFVLVIMLFIEGLNLCTRQQWSRHILSSPRWQVVLGAVLGLIPGCFGGFASVSLYTHGVLNLGALLAAMITNLGDEAFVMLVQMPRITFLLMGGLLLGGILAGWIGNRLIRNPAPVVCPEAARSRHDHEVGTLSEMASHWKEHLSRPSWRRVVLLGAVALFVGLLAFGVFDHHDHETESMLPVGEKAFNSIFYLLAAAVALLLCVVNESFLHHQLWNHLIKKHLLKIFAWTLGALLVMALLNHHVESSLWVERNTVVMLLIAVLIGMIPQSGPHLVMVGLFVGGHIPFAILLANSIMRDGHSTLPLLAESRKTFFLIKGVKAAIALVVGFAALGLF